MHLFDDTGRSISDPDPRAVREVILSLTRDGESFAVLEADEEHYLQASGSVDLDFTLEYRDGSEQAHFGVYERRLSADEVTRAFIEFLGGQQGYRLRYEWEPTFPDSTETEEAPAAPEYVHFGSYENWEARRLLDAFTAAPVRFGFSPRPEASDPLLVTGHGSYGRHAGLRIFVHPDDVSLASEIRTRVFKISL